MTAQEYIDKFPTITSNSNKVDNRSFLNAFGQEFNDTASNTTSAVEFSKVVSEFDTKFRAIKNITSKANKNPIWKLFYAVYVVPKRTEMYPEQQQRINTWREKDKAYRKLQSERDKKHKANVEKDN